MNRIFDAAGLREEIAEVRGQIAEVKTADALVLTSAI
jgi:hypothetical protein